MTIGENIARLRKEKGWTQAELGDKLGVSNQAVSKWESGITMPDIMLLPTMADIFGCYIEELFSREVKTEIHYGLCTEFPWYDDEVIRGVVCEGRKILQCSELVDRFTFEIKGDAKNVQSECNIVVNGNVSGGCESSGDITVNGFVSGGCDAGGDITVGGALSGGCDAGGDIIVGGALCGACDASGDITCGGDFSGNITCNGDVTVKGNVEAQEISGDVVCNSLKCDKIEGDVTIKQADK